jgi:LysR family transcriptional activator of nhaA
VRHINYNHLLYFWTVAREGSIARAAKELHLTPQTISGQLKLLEESVGAPLFHRVGRGLAVTETGRLVNEYADEIFSLGAELAQRVKGTGRGTPVPMHVGIVNSIPKLIAYRIIEPALQIEQPARVVCSEGDLEKLLGDLALHRLDLVISDRPMSSGLKVKAYNHALGQSRVSWFAKARHARRFVRRFPLSLGQAPLLLPTTTCALRRKLDDWLDRVGVAPQIVAEFDDSALLKAFGEAGAGLFPAPDVIAAEIERTYGARAVGVADGVTETYFAISPERKLKHPAVVAITERARTDLFGDPTMGQ